MLKMAHVLRYSVPFAAARSRGMDSFAAAQKTSEGGFASCEGDQRFEYRAPSRARAEAKHTWPLSTRTIPDASSILSFPAASGMMTGETREIY